MDIERRVKDFEEALKGLDFPASRAAMVNKVKDRGGIEGHVAEIAESLPDRTYDWEGDAKREFERLLREHEPEDANTIPAASNRE